MNPSGDKIAYLNFSPLPVLYERAGNPSLENIPFAVVGAVGNRGLIIATSPEAYRAGIRAGVTPETARRFLPEIKFVEERPTEYFHASEEVQDICERFIPMVDAEKQDSFTLDLSGTDRLYPDAAKLIRLVQGRITDEVNLPSRAGLGASRLVARLAAMRADVRDIMEIPVGREGDFLADYHVSVLPGIGVQVAKRLSWLGVHTVRELAAVPPQTLEAAFGPKGAELALASRGHDPRPQRRDRGPKPIKREKILEQLFYDPHAICVALQQIIAGVGLDMRKAGLQTRSIKLELRYPDTPPARRSKRIPPTDLDAILHPIVEEMFAAMFVRRVRIRALSLAYGNFVPRDDQLRLEFARNFTNERNRSLESAMDRIRNKYGVDTIGPGVWWKKKRV